MMNRLLLSAVILLSTGLALGRVADTPNSSTDRPVTVTEHQHWDALVKAMEPHVAKARSTYPDAKARYLKGLPPKHTFSVVTRLHDSAGKVEQVFIGVTRIDSGVIEGRIWSEIGVVSGYHHGDSYRFPESELIDWVITSPDGTEEGNYVGKFLDSLQEQGAGK